MKPERLERFVCALLVGAYERDRQLLREIFKNSGWRLFESDDRNCALSFLAKHPIHVVVTETDVPGWNWKKVLVDLRGMDQPPQLVVTSRHADDRLWAEALNVGAYDVLSQPLERSEVERVIESARRHFEVRPMAVVRNEERVPVAEVA